jgi:NAD(P)H-dependent FMN reductase
VLGQASGRSSASYEIVDLVDYSLPHFDEAMPPSFGQYEHDHAKAWAETIGGYDGFIFVPPEYNHSTSGVLKNAIDFLYAEWNNKAAAFVAYGSLGGARAIEQLRGVCAELQIATVRQQLSFRCSPTSRTSPRSPRQLSTTMPPGPCSINWKAGPER